MIKLKEVSEIKFCLSSNAKESLDIENVKMITPSNLLENNTILELIDNDKYIIDKNSQIINQDIIIKRISPSFINYIDQIENDVYGAGNLIIIRCRGIYPKYLAYLLNINIKKIIDSYSGSSIPSIGRKDIEEFEIINIPFEEQKYIGNLWFLNLELSKMKQKLLELEKEKTNTLLKEYIKTIGGK